MVQQAARDFAKQDCVPGGIERDELQKFSKETGRTGFYGNDGGSKI
jgi:hypothetical protein